MNQIQSTAHTVSPVAVLLAIAIALFAFYQAYRVGKVAYKLYIYRDERFSNPNIQARLEEGPRRSIGRQILFSVLYLLTGICVLLASTDLLWSL
jgi:hypothetical protein